MIGIRSGTIKVLDKNKSKGFIIGMLADASDPKTIPKFDRRCIYGSSKLPKGDPNEKNVDPKKSNGTKKGSRVYNKLDRLKDCFWKSFPQRLNTKRKPNIISIKERIMFVDATVAAL